MSDPLRESITLRSWTNGGVEDLDLRIQTFNIKSSNSSDKTLGDLQWTPVQLNFTSGVEPSSIVFRVPNDTLADADASALSLVRTFSYLKVAGFSGRLQSFQRGLSRQSSTTPQLISNRISFDADARERASYDYDDWPHIVVKIITRGGKRHHVGTFWLSNVSEGDDNGALMTWSDARWINSRVVLNGAQVRMKENSNANSPDSIFVPDYPLVFNAGGRGNLTLHNPAAGMKASSLQQMYSFCQPHEAGNGDVAARWALADMLNYVFVATGGAVKIIRPTSSNNDSYKMWSQLGGELTPELSIDGLSITQALDRIITAAGNYGWTIRPRSRYDSNDVTLWIYEKDWWEADDRVVSYANYRPVVMPSKNLYLPTPGVSVQDADVNVVAHSCDIAFAERYGRVEVVGDPIIVESTFSTDASADRSCLEYDSPATSGTQSLFWQGDEAAFLAAYLAASGSKNSRLKAAMAASNQAYRVVALTSMQTSTYNPVNGYGFASHVNRIASMERNFLPYRLPNPEGTAPFSKPGSANEYPNILVWVRKAGASEWIMLDETGRSKVSGFDVDPDCGGIRFDSPLLTISGSGASTTMTHWDVRVVAAVEFGERLKAEAYREDYDNSTARIISPQGKYRKWLRWNAMDEVGSGTTSAVILDEGDLILGEARRQLCRLERIRVSGRYDIPWCEMMYQVGDRIRYLLAGSSDANSGFPPSQLLVNSPVVGVSMNLQGPPYVTSVLTEDEVQRASQN